MTPENYVNACYYCEHVSHDPADAVLHSVAHSEERGLHMKRLSAELRDLSMEFIAEGGLLYSREELKRPEASKNLAPNSRTVLRGLAKPLTFFTLLLSSVALGAYGTYGPSPGAGFAIVFLSLVSTILALGMWVEIRKDVGATKKRQLPEGIRRLFWEYDFESLRLPEDAHVLVFKVLTLGTPSDVAWLRAEIGDGNIRGWIEERRGRGLTTEQMVAWISPETVSKWRASDPNSLLWERR